MNRMPNEPESQILHSKPRASQPVQNGFPGTPIPTPYFPNLDGLRTIAFLLVYMQHGLDPLVGLFVDRLGVFALPVRSLFTAGKIGVSFFFVLSGFLITYLILDERARTGTINVGAFWARRVLRIWPLYYLVVVFAIVVYPWLKGMIGYGENLEIGRPFLYFVFLGNFDVISLGPGRGAMSTNITWSVAIEEQFYLLWPLLFTFISPRFYRYAFLTIMAGSVTFRFFHYNEPMVLYFHTLSVISYMAIGGLAAFLSINYRSFVAAFGRMKRMYIGVIYIMTGLFFLCGHQIPAGRILVSFGSILSGICFAFIILEQNYAKHSFLKMTNLRWLTRWGKYTYGLYLLHMIAIQFTSRFPRLLHLTLRDGAEEAFTGIGGLVLSAGMAYLSYRLYERPFLRLKDRFRWAVILDLRRKRRTVQTGEETVTA